MTKELNLNNKKYKRLNAFQRCEVLGRVFAGENPERVLKDYVIINEPKRANCEV